MFETANFVRRTLIESVIYSIEKMSDSNTVSRQLAVAFENQRFLEQMRTITAKLKTNLQYDIDKIKERSKIKL